MKKCCTCGVEKRLQDFNKLAKAKDGRQPRCRACAREWYLANREAHKKVTRVRSKATIKTNQFLLIRYLQAHPCIECGEDDFRVLEFDHRDPSSKRAGVANLACGGHPWDVVLAEIDKCDVLCANCHKRKTDKQFGNYRHVYREKFVTSTPRVFVTQLHDDGSITCQVRMNQS